MSPGNGNAVCYQPGFCFGNGLYTGNVPLTSNPIDTITPGLAGPCAPDPVSLHGTIQIYVIWYSSPGRPWTTAAKQQEIDFLTAISSTTYITALGSFPNGANVSDVPTVTKLAVQNPCTSDCYDDPESEGTVFNGSTGLGWCGVLGTDATIIRNTISGAHLPDDPTGIYLILASNNDLTGTLPGFGWHAGSRTFCTGGSQNVPFLMLTNSGAGSNYGSVILGSSLFVLTHEIVETISNNCNGYTSANLATPCGGGASNAEIADVCTGSISNCPEYVSSGSLPSGGPAYLPVPTSMANGYTFTYVSASTTYYTILATYLHNYQGGYCDINPWPAIVTVPCRTAADCPAFSNHCGGSVNNAPANRTCVLPTCSDGIKNGGETDVDCGSNCGVTCASGKSCVLGVDCTSGTCTAGVCI